MNLRPAGAAAAALFLTACATAYPVAPPTSAPRPYLPPSTPAPTPAPSLLELSALPGWADEDHMRAFEAFRQTCGVSHDPGLTRACRSARAGGPLNDAQAAGFLQANLVAQPLPGSGILTAYFAPQYEARRNPDAEFSAPLRPKPADLKAVDAGMFDPSQAGHPGAARDPGDGSPLQPYPDRAAIEATPPDTVLAWLRPEELFFLQVQGSGVLTFEDGQRVKALYAANNGRPFVGIANPMRDRGYLAANNTSGDAIRGWLAAHRGPDAQAIMQLNPRYAFFSLAPDDGRQPVGAAGVPLPAGRSLAVDMGYHSLGELLWIDAQAPILAGAFPAYRRMAMALDTGGAIKGPIRADLYMGQGAAAGAEAGRVRHTLRLYRLIARPDTP